MGQIKHKPRHELEKEIEDLKRGQEILEEACDATIEKYEKEHEEELSFINKVWNKDKLRIIDLKGALLDVQKLVENCNGNEEPCYRLHEKLEEMFKEEI